MDKIAIDDLYKVPGIGEKTIERVRKMFQEKERGKPKVVKEFEPAIVNSNELYFGDCLEVMDSLISKGVKVDAIITDPPY